MIPLHKGGGRCRTGGKRYPLLPTPLKKSHLHLHRLDGFLKKNNNLTKKKILKMWLAGGESNPCVKNIYGLNANMYIYLLYCPIAAAATESPSCQCVKNTLSVTDRVCVIKQIKFSKKFNDYKLC